MHKMTHLYLETCKDFEKILEKNLSRRLLLNEQNALRNAGSLQMLESFSMKIESIVNKEQAEEVLQDLLKMERLNDYIDFFLSKMKDKGLVISELFEKIVFSRGNILDIMLLWESIEEKNLSQIEVDKLVDSFLEMLKIRI